MDLLERVARKAAASMLPYGLPQSHLENLALLSGQMAARQVRGLEHVARLSETEFRVSSQWGEDGIIEWLVHWLGDIPESFIEFGVENYREANTRFLLQHRNWRGLVIDGSAEHVDYIRNEALSWRHDITAVASFITKANINALITQAGMAGEIGILSVDIDGVDYWVWEAIDCVNPHVIIVEYNSVFGDLHPLTVPYAADFTRSNAHQSNLYYGLSIRAAEHLARQRGYTLVGTNRMGNNAFFVRNDRAARILDRLETVEDRPSRFREGRDLNGGLSFIAPAARVGIVGTLPIVNVLTGAQAQLDTFTDLFSPRWQALLDGRSLPT